MRDLSNIRSDRVCRRLRKPRIGGKHRVQRSRERPPQPAVSRILSPPSRALRPLRRMTIIPLAPSSLTGSSNLPGGFGRAVLETPPYLALLRAGFCLPPVLPRARCALTAPFHPYPLPTRARLRSASLRRAVYFLCHFPSGCPDRALPGALPCGVRTFLPSTRPSRLARAGPTCRD